MERKTIFATLEHCSGNKRRAAEVLGVSLKTLYNRLSEYAGLSAELAPQLPRGIF
jgi:DNA-binding NtrC family response regulator